MHKDDELVLKAQSGDRHAVGSLLSRYQRPLYAYAVSVLKNDDEACEIVRNTMLNCFLSMNRLNKPGSFKPWLSGICKNQIRLFYREKR